MITGYHNQARVKHIYGVFKVSYWAIGHFFFQFCIQDSETVYLEIYIPRTFSEIFGKCKSILIPKIDLAINK